jgi:hypothetical protein
VDRVGGWVATRVVEHNHVGNDVLR